MRVIIIGVDGADWSVINQLKLDHIKDGCIMTSTIPPFSPIAWNTLFTGARPEEHGIYGFIQPTPDLKDFEIVGSRTRKVRALWNYYKGVYYKIPFTYPAETIDGVMVPGLGSPDDDYGENKFDLTTEKFRHHALGRLRKEIKELKRLWSTDWQVFSCVFRITDIFQHYYWGKLDILDKPYRRIDKFIGWVLEKKQPEDVVLIVSDHGFWSATKCFGVNTWLHQQGYLNLPTPKNSKLVQFIRKTPLRSLLISLLRLPQFSKYIKSVPMGGFEILKAVDEETIAYYVPGSCTSIVVKDKRHLKKIKALLQGLPFISEVHETKGMYDLVFLLKDSLTFRSQNESGEVLEPLTTGVTGTHNMNGICVAYNTEPVTSIYDIFPKVRGLLK